MSSQTPQEIAAMMDYYRADTLTLALDGPTDCTISDTGFFLAWGLVTVGPVRRDGGGTPVREIRLTPLGRQVAEHLKG